MSTPTRELGEYADPVSQDKPQRSKKRGKSLARELQHLVDNNGKRAKRDLPKCPICQDRIGIDQWAAHYALELERLDSLDSDVYDDPQHKGKRRGAAMVARQQLEKSKNKKRPGSAYDDLLGKVQKNRQHRKQALARLDPTFRVEEDPEALNQALLDQEAGTQTCFICNERLHGDLDAINLHIDNCLATVDAQQQQQQQQQTDSNGDANNGWEEYEWAGQTRVRASAMMEGGYGGAGFATASKREEDEDDEDLDVEDDDDAQYGSVQYTEGDVVFGAEDDEDAEALREMVAGSSSTRRSPDTEEQEQQRQQRSDYEETVSDENWRRTVHEDILQAGAGGHSKLIIESLKSRIQQLEVTARSAPRCLICLEPYKTPLTSIVCWHVHCEQCWLQTLGSKKLCPQCQKITGPSDLRRIYL